MKGVIITICLLLAISAAIAYAISLNGFAEAEIDMYAICIAVTNIIALVGCVILLVRKKQ